MYAQEPQHLAICDPSFLKTNTCSGAAWGCQVITSSRRVCDLLAAGRFRSQFRRVESLNARHAMRKLYWDPALRQPVVQKDFLRRWAGVGFLCGCEVSLIYSCCCLLAITSTLCGVRQTLSFHVYIQGLKLDSLLFNFIFGVAIIWNLT